MMRSVTLCLASAMAAMLMSGCAILPEESVRAKPLPVPAVEQSFSAEKEAEALVRQWPGATWWRSFRNPELDRLIETALKDSPSLHAAIARLGQAEALSETLAAERLPSVGTGFEFLQRRFSATDFYGPNGGKTFTGANFDPVLFRYHLDLWGKDKAALESALGKERAQAAEIAAARLALAAAIARDYFRLCAAAEELEFTKELVSKSEEKARLSRLRWEMGLATRDPLQTAMQSVDSARQREARLATENQVLRYRLSALAGHGPDWGNSIRTDSSIFTQRFPLPDNLAMGLLAHRPDIAAALWRAEAAAQEVKVAKTGFYPDINLVGFAGLHSLNLKDLFLSHGASVAYSVGPTITLPLFEGGRLEAGLKEQRSAYDAAVESYNAVLLQAVRQVADALAKWRESMRLGACQEEALAAAQSNAMLAAQRYRAGLSTLDGEIEAESALLDQRMRASELAAEHLQAAVGLFEALGGGYETNATSIRFGKL